MFLGNYSYSDERLADQTLDFLVNQKITKFTSSKS